MTGQIKDCKSEAASTVRIHHYCGGQISLETNKETIAFAQGRLEHAADLAELCSLALGETNPCIKSSLQLVTAMIFEAREVLAK